MNTVHGDKRNQLIISEKIGHKILLFGTKLFGQLSANDFQHDNAEIEILPFPNEYERLKRLDEFNLVILDYAGFEGSSYSDKQEIFEKQMMEALEAGTNFCFACYNESVPPEDQNNPAKGYMTNKGIAECRAAQIGFRWLCSMSIRPDQFSQTIVTGKVLRSEFKSFLNKWGASNNYFNNFNNGKFDDIIYTHNDSILAFSNDVKKGKIIYIPFQRDLSRRDDLLNSVNTLIDSLLTYITKRLSEIPKWAEEEMFFSEESKVRKEFQGLDKKIKATIIRLNVFIQAKALLCQSEYVLENSLPLFISQQLGLRTKRNEKYNEDFWILNDNEETAIVCEIKSLIKGFRKSTIYSLYNHREANQLEENFPAILFINFNLQAGSWKKKDVSISKSDCGIAAENNILIVRIEDLLRLWDMKRRKKISSGEILPLFLHKKGWLKVSQDHHIEEVR